jgi:hypothetical protein
MTVSDDNRRPGTFGEPPSNRPYAFDDVDQPLTTRASFDPDVPPSEVTLNLGASKSFEVSVVPLCEGSDNGPGYGRKQQICRLYRPSQGANDQVERVGRERDWHAVTQELTSAGRRQ